jgi:hypothetical protein
MFIVDDAVNMKDHWEDAKQVLEALSYIVKQVDSGGIDLCFANSNKRYTSKTSTKLVHAINSIKPQGKEDIKDRLYSILKYYTKQKSLGVGFRKQLHSPLVVYILTNGVCDARSEEYQYSWESAISSATRKIRRCIPMYAGEINIEVICFGRDDSEAPIEDQFDTLSPLIEIR